MYDIPCGMMLWTKPFLNHTWQSDRSFTYVGMDVARSVVHELNHTIKDPRVKVLYTDVSNDVPKVNAQNPRHSIVMSRQMLQHLSNEDACKALKNLVRIPAKYLLLDYFPDSTENRDITTGEFRPINLRLSPFNLPEADFILDDDPEYPRQMFVYESAELRHLKIC